MVLKLPIMQKKKVYLISVILSSVLLRGFLKVIPILIGVVIGLVDFGVIGNASFFTVPQIKIAKFEF